MAKKRKPARRSWVTTIKYAILVLSGGGAGVGGWQYRDSFLGRVVEKARETPQGERIEGLLKERVAEVLQTKDAYKKAGLFEVRVSKLILDPEVFKAGRRVDMQVVVQKIDSNGKPRRVWDTKAFGQRTGVAGNSPLAANWDDSPFEVAWTPGDHLLVEIHDGNSFLGSKVFEMTDVAGEFFPLTSGEHPVTPVARGGKDAHSVESRIVFRTKRVGDLPGPASGDAIGIARGRDNGDTIKIK